MCIGEYGGRCGDVIRGVCDGAGGGNGLVWWRRKLARRRRDEQLSVREPPQGRPATRTSASDGRRRKKFHLQLYKYHSLGDYSNTIRRFGTVDSYSTEPVSIDAYSAHFHPFTYPIRVNLSIGGQRLGTSVQIKSVLSDRLPGSSAGKPDFAESDSGFPGIRTQMKGSPRRYGNIIIWVLLRKSLSTSARL
jgi:hypothetical protein